MEYSVKGFENALRIYKDVVERGENLILNTARVRGSRFYFNTDAETEIKGVVMDEAEDLTSSVEDFSEQRSFSEGDVSKEQHKEYIESATKKQLVEYMDKDLGLVVDDSLTKKQLKAEALSFIDEL